MRVYNTLFLSASIFSILPFLSSNLPLSSAAAVSKSRSRTTGSVASHGCGGVASVTTAESSLTRMPSALDGSPEQYHISWSSPLFAHLRAHRFYDGALARARCAFQQNDVVVSFQLAVVKPEKSVRSVAAEKKLFHISSPHILCARPPLGVTAARSAAQIRHAVRAGRACASRGHLRRSRAYLRGYNGYIGRAGTHACFFCAGISGARGRFDLPRRSRRPRIFLQFVVFFVIYTVLE